MNLAGAPLLSFQRWTEEYKNEVVQSRVGTTKNFVDFVGNLKENKPEVFISMSGVGKIMYSDIRTCRRHISLFKDTINPIP